MPSGLREVFPTWRVGANCSSSLISGPSLSCGECSNSSPGEASIVSVPSCAMRTAALTCTDGSQPLSSPLYREARRPRAVQRAAPSAHDRDAAPVSPRAPAAPFPSVQQEPSSQPHGYGLHATPGGGSAHVPGAAGRDGKRKHGPRRAALGPGGAAGSAAAAAAWTSSSRALRR